ncbi:hypothetical protein FisN_24Hu145 [Fistulifera solaris]|jgi:hypothetical protein|uniref:DUF3291 domain-containing protein n=1 Tax=Fistulifera solaris TaxID=1519565 RepID=A0A1Z5JV97_FISSO|nr:hypothetical protein FisN_24Hu145 [Fistulifera solaris]|eukprot:GAX17786.1 hypothetical protein FisN_24Hu145 [Fistulifera solaris]
MTAPTYYVSITGLQLKSIFYAPLFWYHAIPSMIQARSSPGNIRAEAFAHNGIQHTISVWTDRESMLQYMRKGAHLQAMKVFDTVSGYGKIYGYETDCVPVDQEEILEIWEKYGRLVGKSRPSDKEGNAEQAVP